jgi:hypothetical protein
MSPLLFQNFLVRPVFRSLFQLAEESTSTAGPVATTPVEFLLVWPKFRVPAELDTLIGLQHQVIVAVRFWLEKKDQPSRKK